MKKIAVIAVFAVGIATFAGARNRIHSAEAQYRIELKGNTAVLSRDQPVTRGSVLMFHRSSDGILTSVPSEEVAAIRPLSAQASPGAARRGTTTAAPAVAGTVVVPAGSQPLQPGQAMVIGTTGVGAPTPAGMSTAPSTASSQQNIQGKAAIDNQVFPGDLPAPGTGGTGGSTTNGSAAATTLNPTTNINPTLTGTTTAGTAATATNPVGANGFPATTATGPQSGTNPINSNGFPATTTTGPQSGTNPIGTNGFPTTATAPATSASPANGTGTTTTTAPNGTPATPATAGTTNSAAPAAAPAAGGKSGGSGH